MPATQQTLDKMDRFMSDSQSEALVRAIRCGDLEGVRHALEAGADPDYRDQYGDPGLPLRIASFKGFNGIIRELLDHGAAINPAPNPPRNARSPWPPGGLRRTPSACSWKWAPGYRRACKPD